MQRSDMTKNICLGLSAATGGVLAVLADIAQKGEASAVEHLRSGLVDVGLQTYGWVVALGLVALSVALSFILSADSSKKAFSYGISVIAILMTGVPYSAPPGLSLAPPSTVPTARDSGWWERLMIPPQVLAQGGQPSEQKSPVNVHLQPDDKKQVTSAIVSLVDPGSGQVIARSKVQVESNQFTFYASNRPCTLRVQVDGYAIAERSLNPPPPSLTLPLSTSSVPLAFQRLFRK